MRNATLAASLLIFLSALSTQAAEAKPIKLLFLGDKGHHQPEALYRQIAPILGQRGIEVVYSEKVEDLNERCLAAFDGLIVYANIGKFSAEQEKALLDYVAGGKGFIPIHCASYCFIDSPKYVELVGAQFQKHGTGVFRTVIAEPDHAVMKGFRGFESWDETYVHTRHNEKDRTVLEYRVDSDGKEPWTWVRTHGKGRVFYTAWGHDERTWGNPGFQNLLERGIRWAVGADPSVVPGFADRPEMTALGKDRKPFDYVEAVVPFYPPGTSWGTIGEPIRKMQKPLPAEESMKHMVHPVDFELKLFADESLLGGKPICMNWDERGRLWVAVTLDYPNELQPVGKGRDRILILEDTKGTGRADKVTVFADKLSIPTSLTFARGGLIVQQAPDTLFLRSTRGDDVADERKVLFTGWHTNDTHAGPSNLHYGLDNWIYGIVGYAGFDGTVDGEKLSFRSGFYRFKPDGSRLEFLRSTNNNSWGLGFSEEGTLFGSTANGNPSVYMPIANRYYESVRGWSSSVLGGIAVDAKIHPITDKVRQVDWHGQFTAGAGHALYTARSYPKEYWNRAAFVCEPTGHLVATFEIDPKGADFVSRNSWNLLASDDEWCAPIAAEVGPDGQVWIIDWYNYIVQHNPTPAGFKTGKGGAFETELRDKKHGRIYRLVYKDAKPSTLTLKDASPEKLVETLKNDNMFWRIHAQRLLVERGEMDVVPALIKLACDSSGDRIGLNTAAIHSVWTLHGLGALNDPNLEKNRSLLASQDHRSAAVRRAVAAVMPTGRDGQRALVSGPLHDADAQVRLAAFLRLSESERSEDVGFAIVKALSKPENLNDRWITDAATVAAAAHDLYFLEALSKSRSEPPPKVIEIAAIVAEHYARGGPADTVASIMDALKSAQPRIAETILSGLVKGWPKNKQVKLSAATEHSMTESLTNLSPGAKGQLVRLAKLWGSKAFEKHAAEIASSLLALVLDEKQAEEQRVNAARQLVDFQPADLKLAEKLLDVISPRTSPQLTAGLLEAAGSCQASEVGAAIVERLVGWTPSARLAAVRTLLGRPESTRALLDGLENGKVQLGELALDQKQALSSHADKQIAERAKKLLSRGGGLPNPDRQKVVDELLPLTRKTGDATAGKLVFKNQCAKCHMHSGEGNRIGPDLTGMAVHPKEHLLIDIIDPSRDVEGNYRVYNVLTKDGRTLQGLLASETKTTVELLDAEAKKLVIQRDNIEELTASNKSLMPEGFEKQITRDDLVNLLEFLTQRGKYLPLPLAKAATVVSTKGMFFAEESQVERMIFADWSPKTFEGVPFQLVDPQGDRVANVVLLNGPQGTIPPKMPKSVKVPCNASARAIHLLSGVSGWGYPLGEKGSVTMIVRLHYEDGKVEEHALKNGVHFADYIRRVDVPESKFAFELRSQQIRYLAVYPKREEKIKEIELVKGEDRTAPIVMAVTVETR
jgi:putative membrane-bound dehydrogenase-like protein